VIKAEAS
jgi:hypothetical protein